MKRTVAVGTIACAPGRKVSGFLDVSGSDARMPVTVVNGSGEGLSLLLTASIHGGSTLANDKLCPGPLQRPGRSTEVATPPRPVLATVQ